MKKIISVLIIIAVMLALCACAAPAKDDGTYVIGICNYVDDASLNQIVDSIETRLAELGEKNGVKFEIKYDNCNADANILSQIISDFKADKVDLMVGVATPVAIAMQAETEDGKIPVVFSAVSDPVGVGLVDSLEAPGKNITGTSDYLDTTSIMNLIFAVKPDADKIGLLFDEGQDSSTTPIKAAKEFLDAKGIAYVERTGTNAEEVAMAAQALAADGVDAIFTPTDNTIMKSQLSIYEDLTAAGIPQFTGADSFALNGAFLGYGVDYVELGVKTADLVCDILVNGKNPGETPVVLFDNGTATVNTETCAALGYDVDSTLKTLEPFCTRVQTIVTADSFDDLK